MLATHCVPFVLAESVTLNVTQSRLHGLDHWFRIWKNAQFLTGQDHSADLEVVALYALFHDSMRVNDGADHGHGLRGYKLWERIYARTGLEEYMSMKQRELLFEACAEHSEGRRSTDSTIAVCWDADRMDLHRKGIWPDPRYMSTQVGFDLVMSRVNP